MMQRKVNCGSTGHGYQNCESSFSAYLLKNAMQLMKLWCHSRENLIYMSTCLQNLTNGVAGQSGFLYDFDVCQGAENPDKEKSEVGVTEEVENDINTSGRKKINGRGSMDFRVNQDNIIARWYNNKAVNLISSFFTGIANPKHNGQPLLKHITSPWKVLISLTAVCTLLVQLQILKMVHVHLALQWQSSVHGTSTEETRRSWSPR